MDQRYCWVSLLKIYGMETLARNPCSSIFFPPQYTLPSQINSHSSDCLFDIFRSTDYDMLRLDLDKFSVPVTVITGTLSQIPIFCVPHTILPELSHTTGKEYKLRIVGWQVRELLKVDHILVSKEKTSRVPPITDIFQAATVKHLVREASER